MTFEELQSAVRDVLTADSWFSSLPVLVEARGDVEQELQRALNELGLSVVISTPQSRQSSDNAKRPLVEVTVLVSLAEMPMTNQTGKTATQALDRLIGLLHGHSFSTHGATRLLYRDHRTEDVPGMNAHSVNFTTKIVHET